MLAFSRFRVPPQEQASFLLDAERAAAWFAGRPGCRYAEVVGNLDEPDQIGRASCRERV